MVEAFLWGLVATSSLVVGGILGIFFNISQRVLGAVMAFGAGVLISAVSYELVYEAVSLGKWSGAPTAGLAMGALTFFLADRWIGNLTGGKSDAAAGAGALLVPMVLAILLDGIPESLVIGLGILEGGTVSLAMLVAVFISNVPEAIAGTSGMRASGWGRGKILGLWSAIAVFCALATVSGYALFGDVPDFWLSFVQAFAAGAILCMLANSMMPEAFENGGKIAGLLTVLGFALAVLVTLMEKG